MHRFKAAVFGTGFVGRVHLEGIRRLGYVQVYAIGESEVEKAAQEVLKAGFILPYDAEQIRQSADASDVFAASGWGEGILCY